MGMFDLVTRVQSAELALAEKATSPTGSPVSAWVSVSPGTTSKSITDERNSPAAVTRMQVTLSGMAARDNMACPDSLAFAAWLSSQPGPSSSKAARQVAKETLRKKLWLAFMVGPPDGC